VPNNNPSGAGAFDFPLRLPGQYFDKESNLAYNYFRDYDPNIGRYVESDPIGLDGSADPYLYAENNPTMAIDPLGLYIVKPGVPAPSPRLDKLLKCMDKCPGMPPIFVTGTTPVPGEKHKDPGHAGGTSVDIRPPKGIPPDLVFCCAGKCGATWGINEGPGGSRLQTPPPIIITSSCSRHTIQAQRHLTLYRRVASQAAAAREEVSLVTQTCTDSCSSALPVRLR
jgi:RHS repeat-associated protein